MKSLLLYLLFFLGLATLLYYIYLIVIGKRLARLMESKDRYIWNGLRNLNDSSFSKKSTVFLDERRLIVARGSLTDVYSKLRSGGLENAIVMNFDEIVAFDYDAQGSFFLIKLFNRIFKVNNFILKIDYLQPGKGVEKLRFKASSMDPLDFESAFADFNNKIYGDKLLLKSNEVDTPVLGQDISKMESFPVADEVTTAIPVSTFEEDSPRKKEIVSSPLDDFEKTSILPLDRLKEELPEVKVSENEVDFEKTTVIPREQLLEIVEEVPTEDAFEKTVAMSPLSASLELTSESLPEEKKSPEPLQENQVVHLDHQKVTYDEKLDQEDHVPLEQSVETGEIQRRSFLDRKPQQKKPSAPSPKKEETKVSEDKTIAVELPDELKRKDQSGLTEEQITAQEMERLKKLKEFFAKENSEEY